MTMTTIMVAIAIISGIILIKMEKIDKKKKEEEWTMEQKLFVTGMDRANDKKKY